MWNIDNLYWCLATLMLMLFLEFEPIPNTLEHKKMSLNTNKEAVKLMKRQQDLWHHGPHGSQTKQSCSTTCVWFSFRPFLPTFALLSFFFPFSLGKVGGGSRRWRDFVSSLFWTQHHSSSGWRLELVSAFVSALSLLLTLDHPFLLLISYHSLLLSLSPGKPSKRNFQGG